MNVSYFLLDELKKFKNNSNPMKVENLFPSLVKRGVRGELSGSGRF
jgi:hypothetical protein